MLAATFKWLTLLSLLCLLAASLWMVGSDGGNGWLAALFLFAWMGTPLALPYILSWGECSDRIRSVFFLFFLIEVGFVAHIWHGVLNPQSSTDVIALVTAPVLLWTALPLFGFLTAAVTGWRPSLSEPGSRPPRQSPPPG